MRVILLTYSFNYNYGGLLQAYATVKYLQSHGHEVTVPVAYPPHMIGNTSLFRGMGLSAKKPWTAVLRRMRQRQRYARFDAFRKKLPLDPSLNSKEAIVRKQSEFDAILTGSDQTWNTKFMPKYDSYFFQGFITDGVRKVSYASCFGTKEQNESVIAHAAADLSKLDHAAVRNEVSRQIFNELTGLSPVVVVDPTLLHDFSEFISESAPAPAQEGFVMVYALDVANFSIAARIVEELLTRNPKLDVHFVNGEKNFEKPEWATRLINSYGPEEFLHSIQRAAFVVTDSFHGLIFAQKFGAACIGYTSGWRSERIVGMMKDFDASDLLLTDSGADSIKRAVGLVVDGGARLRISASLQEKIELSRSYLSEALSPA